MHKADKHQAKIVTEQCIVDCCIDNKIITCTRDMTLL